MRMTLLLSAASHPEQGINVPHARLVRPASAPKTSTTVQSHHTILYLSPKRRRRRQRDAYVALNHSNRRRARGVTLANRERGKNESVYPFFADTASTAWLGDLEHAKMIRRCMCRSRTLGFVASWQNLIPAGNDIKATTVLAL